MRELSGTYLKLASSKCSVTMQKLAATATNSPDLEVRDAQLIFGAVWRELEGGSAATR